MIVGRIEDDVVPLVMAAGGEQRDEAARAKSVRWGRARSISMTFSLLSIWRARRGRLLDAVTIGELKSS